LKRSVTTIDPDKIKAPPRWNTLSIPSISRISPEKIGEKINPILQAESVSPITEYNGGDTFT